MRAAVEAPVARAGAAAATTARPGSRGATSAAAAAAVTARDRVRERRRLQREQRRAGARPSSRSLQADEAARAHSRRAGRRRLAPPLAASAARGRVPADARRPARDDRLGDAARSPSSPARRARRRGRCGSGRSAAPAGARSPGRGRRGSGSAAISRAQARGRPTTPSGVVRLPARRCTASRRARASVTRYHRIVCGDWWVEDPASPLLQPLPPRALRLDAAVPHQERGPVPLADGLPPPGGDRLQHEPGRPRPRLGDLPPRQHRAADARLREPAAPAPGRDAALAAPRGGR